MSQPTSSKGIYPLASGNLLRWHSENIPGSHGALRAEFRTEPTEEDMKEAYRYLESMVPEGSKTYQRGTVKGAQRVKAVVESFMGQGGSN